VEAAGDFLCENNRYGWGTAFERVAAVTDIVEHACSYDMAPSCGRHERADGIRRDPASRRARTQEQPSTLLECARIRSWATRCPTHCTGLPDQGRGRGAEGPPVPSPISPKKAHRRRIIDQAALDTKDAGNCAEVEAAVKFADREPGPDPDELYSDVLAD